MTKTTHEGSFNDFYIKYLIIRIKERNKNKIKNTIDRLLSFDKC